MELGILVLAGGNSERLGENKALYKINETPLIEFVVNRVSELDKGIIISCKERKEELEKLFPKHKIIEDKLEKEGPLTGLLTALPHVKSEYVAIVTCDCPKIKPDVIKRLAEEAQNADGSVPKWPNGYIEPLQAVYDTSKLAEATDKVWKKGNMKVSEALERLQINYISTEKLKSIDPTLESFLNLNHEEDILKIKNNLE
ncbi:hypothetical protein AKJ61_00600 [candidate division MSBL1 archaeon SCGC-AAA259B11]|uniref:Probable molybdenum cofactor guanylyltransferase n=1 Tax=candidate division MSBL1 archaeon SCGC-AAA259B11 TaxID=1698260 RepID=A0A133U8M9_9EURY|nr:hypothetical protein AKJ61_00600 [candidate division MSBL1 archaeon SCGC-AAA259B11]